MKSGDLDQLIEDALRSEPAFYVKTDFKDRVVTAIKQKERSSQRRLYIMIALGTILMISLGLLMLIRFAGLQTLSSLENLVPIAILAGCVVVLVQYLDKRLVKDRFFNQPI